MECLRGKVVIITGAAGGIGSCIAKLFSESRSNLFLTDLNPTTLDALVVSCKKDGASQVHGLKVDVKNMNDLENIVKKTVEYFGRIDILVNCVGFATKQSFAEHTEELYDSTMDVNLKATFFLTKLAIAELVKTKGTIVNLSSAAAINPEPRFLSYSVAKAGIDHFTRCLAREYAPKGIRVNAINPGPVRTGFYRDHSELEKMSALQPLCGILEPIDIARWVIFLASEQSGPVTGQTILVDGGRTVTRVPEGYGPLK